MREHSTTPTPQLIFCLEKTHTIMPTTGDGFACIHCGMAFRSESRDPQFFRTTENLLGRTFERLKVIGFAGYKQRGKGKSAWWVCQCIEGNVLEVRADDLKHKRKKSCGCLVVDIVTERSTTHGKSHTPEYNVWASMIQRCRNPHELSYVNYGGRGIFVCERWQHDFGAFYDDMGPRPTPKHTLERIDNDGPYSPENCKWATRTEQVRNRRSNHRIPFQGRLEPLAVWAEEAGMKQKTLAKRLHDGWTMEEAMSIPVAASGIYHPRRNQS